MKAVRFQPQHEAVHTTDRAIVGNCPGCGLVLVVFNAHETWPWIACRCSWEGSTTDFSHVRYVRGEAVLNR